MPSLTTAYRAIVMVASGVIVVKGWQYCGPSAAQVKAIARRAAEIGQETWGRVQSPQGPGRLAEAGPGMPTLPANRAQAPVTVNPSGLPLAELPPAAFSAVDVPNEPGGMDAARFSQSLRAEEVLAIAPQKSAELPASDGRSLTMLLTRLKELGGIEPALEPWGKNGNLYRFCCRAKLADNSHITRHFEAVATERLAAVENVVAKLESWHSERARSQH